MEHGLSDSLSVFMVAMIFAPVIIRVSEKAGMEWFARPAAYGGYIWFGLLFLFLCASLLLDLWRLLVYAAGLVTGGDFSPVFDARKVYFLMAALCAVVVSCYGLFEAERVRIERIVIHTDKLPQGVDVLRIAQISDVHVGLIVNEGRLKKIVEIVRKTDPHLLVSTGDLLDGQTDSVKDLARFFKEFEPPLGKIAITGNHEFYAGFSNFISFASDGGFRILRGEAVEIGGMLNVAGIDDIAAIPFHLYKGVKEKDLLSGLPRERFTLLLKHRPVVDRDAVGLFDLQLSGHTHKGQIYPFIYATKMFFPYATGFFNLEEGSRLYVSRGTGTWGPPVRFLAPPEVTVIELRRLNRTEGQSTS